MLKTIVGSAVLATALCVAGSASAQYSDNKVKIGVLTDMTGAYSDLAGKGSVEAARMAIEDFNDTINGQPVELVSADHQNKADIASTTARRWYDVDGVDAIFDINSTVAALAVREISKAKGKVDINSGAASLALTNKLCSPTGLHWTYDVHALATGTANAVLKEGGDTWFFITADYAFGHDLEAQVSKIVKAKGGKVLGSVSHPFPNSDFSSFLLKAQASGAKIIGMANAGADTINTVKQAREFGIPQGGQTLGAIMIFLTDVHSLGLEAAQGMVLTTGFYWDLDDKTRAFSQRFAKRMGGKMPTMVQAGVYSSVLHYLRAAKAAGTDEGAVVVAKMRELPIDDAFAKNGKIRADGRMVHDMFLARVKAPEKSKGPWDYYEIVRVIPGDEAFQPLSESTCDLVAR